MYCPRCGKLLRPEARFCGDCGLELEPRHPSWESGSVYAQPSNTVVLFHEAFYSGTLSVDPSGSVYSEQQKELTGAFDNKLLGAFGEELLYVGPAVAYAWRRFLPDLLPEETLS